jgi:hypothetical protein
MKNPFSNGTIFGDTANVNKHIRTLYPEAKFVPVCALGCYYTIYSDSTYSKQIAEYDYLTEKDKVTEEARNEMRPFGSYFKLSWIN